MNLLSIIQPSHQLTPNHRVRNTRISRHQHVKTEIVFFEQFFKSVHFGQHHEQGQMGDEPGEHHVGVEQVRVLDVFGVGCDVGGSLDFELVWERGGV